MALFRFEVRSGADLLSREEADLPDVAAARRQGVLYAMAATSHNNPAAWPASAWQVSVIDAAGLTILRLTMTSGTDD